METQATAENKIPKIIHYVWMGGGKKSGLIEQCIASWHKYCPDYQIIEWNEQNFDVDSNPIIRAALAQKNWALASDIIRLRVVYENGGIYLDTDAELIKPLDKFLVHEAFIGYENELWLNPATFGAVKGHPFLARCLARYESNAKINFSTNPLTVHTYAYVAKSMYGLKLNGRSTMIADGFAVYAEDFFCPQNYMTYRLLLTDNSHVIHRYTSTWYSKSQRFWSNFSKRARKILGRKLFKQFERIVRNGYFRTLKKEYKRIDRNQARKGSK